MKFNKFVGAVTFLVTEIILLIALIIDEIDGVIIGPIEFFGGQINAVVFSIFMGFIIGGIEDV